MGRIRLLRGADRTWWTSFLVLLLMGALWSLASPLFSVADEPAHVVRAAAVGRGQLGGRDSTDFADHQVRTEVDLPLVYATATTLPACYLGHASVPAGCAPAFAGPRTSGPVLTQVGRYPPAYYAFVGLPTRWLPAAGGVRAMRLLTAAAAAALLASAFASLRRAEAGGTLVLGLAVAVTPTVLFLAGSVNPSGVELAAAAGFWTALTGLFLGAEAGGADEEAGGSTAPDEKGFAVRAAVAGSILLLTRQLGPLMVALVALVMVVAAGPARLRALAGRPQVRRAAAVLGVAGVAAVAWIVARHTFSGVGGTPPPNRLSMAGVVKTSLGRTPWNVLQMIGRFGWTDTPAPAVTYYLWFGCLGLLAFAALACGDRRRTAALVLLAVLVVAVPVALESARARQIGFAWLGRYTLPLAMGLPLLCARMGSQALAGFGRRLVPLVAGAVAVAHLLAFVWALNRYAGGLGFTVDWAPPGSAPLLVFAFAAACALYGWWLTRLVSLSPQR